MGSATYRPRRIMHEIFLGDSDMERWGREQELAPERAEALPLEERYLGERGKAETYGMRMLVRSL